MLIYYAITNLVGAVSATGADGLYPRIIPVPACLRLPVSGVFIEPGIWLPGMGMLVLARNLASVDTETAGCEADL